MMYIQYIFFIAWIANLYQMHVKWPILTYFWQVKNETKIPKLTGSIFSNEYILWFYIPVYYLQNNKITNNYIAFSWVKFQQRLNETNMIDYIWNKYLRGYVAHDWRL